MKFFFGGLIILAGLVLGVWLGVFVMFIGGIVQIVNEVKGSLEALPIAWGILRIILAGAVGWISAIALIIPGFVLATHD